MEKESGKSQPSVVYIALIGKKSSSITPPFLVTFEIFNMNVNNYLDYSRESYVLIPYYECKRLNVEPKKTSTWIEKLDRSKVKVMGELKDVLIILASNHKDH